MTIIHSISDQGYSLRFYDFIFFSFVMVSYPASKNSTVIALGGRHNAQYITQERIMLYLKINQFLLEVKKTQKQHYTVHYI